MAGVSSFECNKHQLGYSRGCPECMPLTHSNPVEQILHRGNVKEISDLNKILGRVDLHVSSYLPKRI